MQRILSFLIIAFIALSPIPALAATYEDVIITVLDTPEPPLSPSEEEVTITVIDAQEPAPPPNQEDVSITVIDRPNISVTPLQNSTFSENDTVPVSANISDFDASSLEYQFSVDGQIKQAWSKKSKYDWEAISGRHNLEIVVRDTNGQDIKQAEVYIFRKPLAAPE